MAAPVVYIVEDEHVTRELIASTVERAGFTPHPFASAEEYLAGIDIEATHPRCSIIDYRLPGMDGLLLQERLRAANVRMPLIFLTAFADVPMVVKAMKQGAFDFLQKPWDPSELIDCVRRATQHDSAACLQQQASRKIADRLAKLTPREREVLDLLVTAHSTKAIAARLAINSKTVFVHRARVMEKMGVESLVELSRLVSLDGPVDGAGSSPLLHK